MTPKSEYKNPVCRGSYELGTACGMCERCEETKSLGKPKKDTGYKKLQRERDEYFSKWGEYMKRANVAEERIKQLEGLLEHENERHNECRSSWNDLQRKVENFQILLGECEELLKIAEKNLFFEGSDVYESRITSVLVKLKAAKEGK